MGTLRTLSTFVLAGLLALSLGAGTALAQETGKDAKKDVSPKKMILTGMSFGVLRVPEIAVWSCPGGQMAGCTLVGQIKSGTEVTRYEKEKGRGLDWYRIEGGGMTGWVRDTFLESPS
jgi:hypothetical protein